MGPGAGSAQHTPFISVWINLWAPMTHSRSAMVIDLWSKGLGTVATSAILSE